MDEIRLLSAVLYLIAASLNLTKTIIDSRNRKKPSPPQSEKVPEHPKE